MTDFVRFPSTPHLAWLASGPMPRGDKLLSSVEAREFLRGAVTVEEKLDGANIGVSASENGRLRVQNRGQYLHEPYRGQFGRLPAWLSQHSNDLSAHLAPGLILFGEWCTARHSIRYDRLPDWLLVFDVYDRAAANFWSSARRDEFAAALGLVTVPTLLSGTTNIESLKHLLEEQPSGFGEGCMEGVIVRRETPEWCDRRVKLVRSDFTQAIGEHWSRRSIEWNRRAS